LIGSNVDDVIVRLVELCVRRLPSCTLDDTDSDIETSVSMLSASVGGGVSAASVGVVSACLLTSLRLLLNITHDNGELYVLNVQAIIVYKICILTRKPCVR